MIRRRSLAPVAAAAVATAAAAQPVASSAGAFPQDPGNVDVGSTFIGRLERGVQTLVQGPSAASSHIGFRVFDADGDVILPRDGGPSSSPSTNGGVNNLADGTYFIATYRDTSRAAADSGDYRINRGNASLPVNLTLLNILTSVPIFSRTNLPGTPTYFHFIIDRPSISRQPVAVTTRPGTIRFSNPDSFEIYAVYNRSGGLLSRSRIVNEETDRQEAVLADPSAGSYFVGVTSSTLEERFFPGFRVNPVAFGFARNYRIDIRSNGGAAVSNAFSGTLTNAGFEFFQLDVRDEGTPVDVGRAASPGTNLRLRVDALFVPRLALFNADTGELISEETGDGGFNPFTVSRVIDLPSGLPAGNYELAVASGSVSFDDGFFSLVDGTPQGEEYSVIVGDVTAPGTFFLESRNDLDFFAFTIAEPPTPCSPADLVEPFGVISQADVDEFVSLFFANDPGVAALAGPTDIVSQADVSAFVGLFFAGCPSR